MGGSQSKFGPQPHDAWCKFKCVGKAPRFLQSVLQTLVDLNDSRGCSQGRIINHIQGIINEKGLTASTRRVAIRVKNAINYAVAHRMIKQRSGRYFMALSKRDFQIFKGMYFEGLKKDKKNKKKKAQKEIKEKLETHEAQINQKQKIESHQNKKVARKKNDKLGDDAGCSNFTDESPGIKKRKLDDQDEEGDGNSIDSYLQSLEDSLII